MSADVANVLSFLLAALIGGAIFVGTVVFPFVMRKKVLRTSRKIAALEALNREIAFHPIKDKFEIDKKYDSKHNFESVFPEYLLIAEIRANLFFYSEYANQIRENRGKYIQYQEKLREICSKEYPIEYSGWKIPEPLYRSLEASLFEGTKLTPTVDCTFHVKASFQPSGEKDALVKEGVFNYEEMYGHLESIAEASLDKNTNSHLIAVERSEVSDALRYDILRRDNFTCVICGASQKLGVRLHVDHIVPVSKGGKSVASNLRTLCERCNVGKSDKMETGAALSEEKEMTCKRCGARMVLRHGQYGDFYGCSNYPKCKFARRK
jgi:hypothetical protein